MCAAITVSAWTRSFLKRNYEPFERVNSSTISGVEGTGLGMSIVLKLVEAMKGTIDIKSKPGEGTEVRIEIPLPCVKDKEAPAVILRNM